MEICLSTLQTILAFDNEFVDDDNSETSTGFHKIPSNEPYRLDIAAGKNSYVYDAHTYHTKVPPAGIATLIEHYTNPGDIILDPFCGSGMAGVAATELGRRAILSDLSPAAAFIALHLNTPISAERYMSAVNSLLASTHELELSLFGTHCRTCHHLTPMLYMVWSFGMLCKHCQQEFVLWDVARDEKPRPRDSKIRAEFPCPHCGRNLKKRELKRTIRYPVQVGYRCCHKGLTEAKTSPDEYDLKQFAEIEQHGIPSNLWYPTNPFPDGMNTKQAISAGITSVDRAYTPRSLWAMALLWKSATDWPDEAVRSKLLFTLTSLYQRVTLFSEFRFWGGSSNTANFNVPAIANEQNVFKTFERKAKTIALYFRNAPKTQRDVQVSTRSACHLDTVPDGSIDFVFTDPPFGANINYSEMNFLWESWLGEFTETREEAIVNKVQGKGYLEYEKLLAEAFEEIRRVLKDDGWLNVVFHNSSSQAWAALQEALQTAGFAIEGTQTFDKKHGTFKQFVSHNAVGIDLILRCRKSDPQQLGHTVQEPGFVHEDALNFMQSAISSNPERYMVHYLHVDRRDEFDYRRLYAEWLADALPKARVSLSFDEFRGIADSALSSLTQSESMLLEEDAK